MNPFTIRAACVGTTEVPTCEIYWMDKIGEFEPLWFIILLLQNDKHTFLVNSGPPEDFSQLTGFWEAWHPKHKLSVTPDQRIPSVLKRWGIAPEQIDGVFVSPLTAYAAGNLHLFPKAKFYLMRKGWTDIYAPTPYLHRFPRYIYMPRHVEEYLLFQAFERIVLLDDQDTKIVPGITTWYSGVHHRSSMCLMIDTEKGKAAVSDSYFKYGNIERRHMLGITENFEETYRAYDRIKHEASLVVPIYDPELFKRHPEGQVA